MSVVRSITFGLAAAWIASAATVYAQQDDQPKLDVHFVPTPEEIVNRMLAMAQVTADDFVIDLGSGDGRIVITAAKKYGARGLGIDLDPQRIKEANENLRKAGVADKVEFRQQNLFDTDLSKATVLTMYLLPRLNLELRPRLLDLKPGTRIASHAFDMGTWQPDRHEKIDGRDAYFWVVPAKVAGRWQVQDGEGNFTIELKQEFQEIEGTAQVGGKTVPLRDTKLRGAEIGFVVENASGVARLFQGRVDGNRIESVPTPATSGGPRPAGNWRASRSS